MHSIKIYVRTMAILEMSRERKVIETKKKIDTTQNQNQQPQK